MGIGRERGRRIIPEPSRDDMQRDAGGQRQGCRAVSEDVQRPGRNPGRLAVLLEPLREVLRLNRATELIGKHEVLVVIGIRGEVPLEDLGIAVAAQHVHGLGVEGDRAPRTRRLRWAKREPAWDR